MCVTIVGVCRRCKGGFSGRTQYCHKGMDGIVCVDPNKVRRRMVGPISTTTVDGSYINMLEVTKTEVFEGMCKKCRKHERHKRRRLRKLKIETENK